MRIGTPRLRATKLSPRRMALSMPSARMSKAQGKTLGRPQALSSDQRKDVLQRLAAGDAVAALARALKTSRATIMRTRGAAAA